MGLWHKVKDTVKGAAKEVGAVVANPTGVIANAPLYLFGQMIKEATKTPDMDVPEGTGEGEGEEIVEAPAEVDMPAPTFVSYDPITQAPYKMVNISKFAQRWGNINRAEVSKNVQMSKDLALSQLDTELQGLQNYAPAAAALQRQEIAADNIFNQQQKEAQVAKALPGVKEQLAAQAARAESFASGRMPSDIEDRALELGIRSQAADTATAAGFGASSSVSRKASDLLSAQQRITLSQYGDQLLTGNINQKASLFLAPTEYANAGSQIQVMPSVSGSQLQSQNFVNLNNLTTIPATAALSTRVNQKQFATNLTQRTNEFNATNKLATDQFNANAANTFALQEFAYQVGYEGTLAGVATANNEIALQLQQQQQYYQMMQQYMEQQQQMNMISGIGSFVSQLFSVGMSLF